MRTISVILLAQENYINVLYWDKNRFESLTGKPQFHSMSAKENHLFLSTENII